MSLTATIQVKMHLLLGYQHLMRQDPLVMEKRFNPSKFILKYIISLINLDKCRKKDSLLLGTAKKLYQAMEP